MTLIALHADAEHATILTDTLSYTKTASRLGSATKVHVLPHLDAAVMTHGSAELGIFWATHAALRAKATTFDELLAGARAALRDLWNELALITDHRNAVHGAHSQVPRSVAFAVGYSDAHEHFEAWSYSSDEDFQPTRLEGLFAIPTPLDVRPSQLEQRRLEETFMEQSGSTIVARALATLPPPAVPACDDEWVALARTVREQRALADLYTGLKMYVGGHAMLTRLERGSSTTRRAHTFDDAGAEFEQMMAGSLHPAGQRGPCPCGSREAFVECCLRQIFDDACPCGSGRTFAGCCRVDGPRADGGGGPEHRAPGVLAAP